MRTTQAKSGFLAIAHSLVPRLVFLLLLAGSLEPQTAWAQQDRRAEYADYALQHAGDSAKGEALFRRDGKSQCTDCHAIVGMEKSGPNLEGIGDKYTRRQLIQQVLAPSAEIKPGFEQITVLTDDGRVISGRLERANRVVHRIINAEGRQINVPTDEISESKVVDVSMMPEGLEQSLSAAQFADLIAYLESLKFQQHTAFITGGQPIEIPRLPQPVTFQAIHPPGMAFENPVWEAHRQDSAVFPETWAIGFREPWRFSFDAETGELYLGDVGQDAFEEVCLVEPGENHGWNVKEGFDGFSEEYRRPGDPYVEPLLAYPHGLGFSVTGGYVYRGGPIRLVPRRLLVR